MCVEFRDGSQILSWWQSKYPRDLQKVLEEKTNPYTNEDTRCLGKLGNYHIIMRSTHFRPEDSKRYIEVEAELRENMTGKGRIIAKLRTMLSTNAAIV